MDLLKSRKIIGNKGEDIACGKIREMGFEVLDRNYYTDRHAEIDIIAKDIRGIIHFIEVKTRSNNEFGTLEETISVSKVMNLQYAATKWLIMNNLSLDDTEFQFDFFGLILDYKYNVLREVYIPNFIEY